MCQEVSWTSQQVLDGFSETNPSYSAILIVDVLVLSRHMDSHPELPLTRRGIAQVVDETLLSLWQ